MENLKIGSIELEREVARMVGSKKIIENMLSILDHSNILTVSYQETFSFLKNFYVKFIENRLAVERDVYIRTRSREGDVCAENRLKHDYLGAILNNLVSAAEMGKE